MKRQDAKTQRRNGLQGGRQAGSTLTPGTLKIPKVLVRLVDLRLCVFAPLRLCVKLDTLRQAVDHAMNSSLQQLNAKTPSRRDAIDYKVGSRLAVPEPPAR